MEFIFRGKSHAILALDVRDSGLTRTYRNSSGKLFELLFRALRLDFDRAVTSVLRMAGDAKPFGLFQAEIAEPHALHAARNDEVDAFHRSFFAFADKLSAFW